MKTKYYCDVCCTDDHKRERKGCRLKMNGQEPQDHNLPTMCVIGGDCKWVKVGLKP
jgi:hypothetical protein